MTTKKCIRILSLVLALLLLSLSLCSCSASRRVMPSFRANRTVAKAGNVKIPYANLYYITMTRIAELKEAYGEDALDSEQAKNELKAFVVDNLWTRYEALISVGLDYDLDVTKGDIAASVQKEMETTITQDFDGDRKAYIEILDAKYLTDAYVRTYIGVENYLASAIVKEMIARGEVDDSDDAVRALFAGDDFICVRQVFLDATHYSNDEAARAKAQELRDLVAAESDAAARADKMLELVAGPYNQDFGDTLGTGYYYARGEMNESFERAAFGIAEYAVSEVVATDGGYAFVMRFPKDETYMEEHFEELKQKSYYIHLNNKVQKRQNETKLELTRYGERLDLTDLPAIRANGGEIFLLVAGVVTAVVAVAAVRLVSATVLILRCRKGAQVAAKAGARAKHGGKTKRRKK